jgi:hypothetical protein
MVIPFLTPAPVLAQRQWKLSAADRRLAVMVAKARQGDNEDKARPDAYGARGGLQRHIEGAMAELAFARMAGVDLSCWYAFVNTADLKSIPYDVAGCQVRSTTHGRGRLVIHRADIRDHGLQPYVLVLNRCPVFEAKGWMYACEADRAEWWDQPNPGQAAAFWVPQADLNPWPC